MLQKFADVCKATIIWWWISATRKMHYSTDHVLTGGSTRVNACPWACGGNAQTRFWFPTSVPDSNWWKTVSMHVSHLSHLRTDNRRCFWFSLWKDIQVYLMNAKVGVRVKVVVSWGHLLRAKELGHLPPPRTAREAGSVGRVRWQRRPWGMLYGRHRLGQRGGLRRLGRNYADWPRLWLWLLERER